MKKLKLYMLLVTILMALLLILNMKNISKYIVYILIGIAGIAIGFTTTKLFSKCKAETVFVPGEIVLKDTCLDNRLLCTITSKDSINIYRIIREGLKVKEPKNRSRPKIEEVKMPDVPVTTSVLERTYTKILDNGILTVWDTLKVLGTIEDWNRAYKVNEVVEVQEKVTNTTAVIEKGEDDGEVVKYLPVEVPRKKETWIGLNAEAGYYDRVVVPVGLSIQSGRMTVGLNKDILSDFKTLDGYSIGLKYNLLRVSAK